MYRNLSHFYTLTVKLKKVKEAILFIIALKIIKYLEINLPKKAKDLYSKDYKMLMKEIEDNTNMERYTLFLG